MTKVFTIITFNDKTGDQELTMKLTLKKPIEGETFEERKAYVSKLASKEARSNRYAVQWKEPFGCGSMEGYLHVSGA